MKKNRKKKKRVPNDGGLTLEAIQHFYPKAKDIRMECHSLSLDERKYITNWLLHKRVAGFYAVAVLEVLLIILIIVIRVAGIGKQSEMSDMSLALWLILAIGVFLGIFVLLRNRNTRQLNSIDFDKVQEVVYITSGGKTNRNVISFYKWDEEKQKFYMVRMKMEISLYQRYGSIMYYPCESRLLIPRKQAVK